MWYPSPLLAILDNRITARQRSWSWWSLMGYGKEQLHVHFPWHGTSVFNQSARLCWCKVDNNYNCLFIQGWTVTVLSRELGDKGQCGANALPPARQHHHFSGSKDQNLRKPLKHIEHIHKVHTYPYISFLNKFIHCNDQGPKKRQSPSPKKVVSPPSSAAPWCPPADCSPNTRGGSNERLRSSYPASLAWHQAGWRERFSFILRKKMHIIQSWP